MECLNDNFIFIGQVSVSMWMLAAIYAILPGIYYQVDIHAKGIKRFQLLSLICFSDAAFARR
jgi:hypothetical protein